MARVAGIDIGGTKARICVQDAQGERIEELPTGAAMTAGALAAALHRCLAAGPPVDAIGIAVPGLVEDGTVVLCDVLPDLAGWKPATAFSSMTPHVLVLNDAKAGCVEAAAGRPADSSLVLVMAGTGIGAAIVVRGEPLDGASGWAGELGLIPAETADGVARLDDIASGRAILDALQLDADTLHARLAAGDARARRVVAQAGGALGLGLATVVQLLNPDALVLAGGTLRYAGYLEAARASLDRWALAPLRAACRIDVPHDGHLLVCRGAARRARARLPDRMV
jgi:predicted NBD/HSP70 family sugar kinase